MGHAPFIGTALIFPGNAEEALGPVKKRLNRPALTINPDDCVVRDGQLRTPKGQPLLGFTPPVPYEDDFDRKRPCDCRECGDTQPD
ncbi:MAG: hypothetical protein C7B43_10605 [Sulfobacillus benefaciens]|uniref:Uncharacterized protein n=1 Tax=Sulfobacillus benefaciens TaxID=453960 RepID=A0A2T2X101_9FIRM|nr:MAG: hypothetical protein C7B43_10605 [Sulfobacillus benefaciens]